MIMTVDDLDATLKSARYVATSQRDRNRHCCAYRSSAARCSCSYQHHTHGSSLGSQRYAAIGQTVVQTGPAAPNNPFRFSTKYHDPYCGLVNYGCREYGPGMGRWPNRDPVTEFAFAWAQTRQIAQDTKRRFRYSSIPDPCYLFLRNAAQIFVDPIGLEASDNRQRRNPECACKEPAVNEAAKNAIKEAAADRGTRDNLERAGRLCCNPSTRVVMRTDITVGWNWQEPDPVTGETIYHHSSDGRRSKPCSSLGNDWSDAGLWHLHPIGDPNFSPIDRDYIRVASEGPLFVGDGGDTIRRLDPAVRPAPPGVSYPPFIPADPIESTPFRGQR